MRKWRLEMSFPIKAVKTIRENNTLVEHKFAIFAFNVNAFTNINVALGHVRSYSAHFWIAALLAACIWIHNHKSLRLSYAAVKVIGTKLCPIILSCPSNLSRRAKILSRRLYFPPENSKYTDWLVFPQKQIWFACPGCPFSWQCIDWLQKSDHDPSSWSFQAESDVGHVLDWDHKSWNTDTTIECCARLIWSMIERHHVPNKIASWPNLNQGFDHIPHTQAIMTRSQYESCSMFAAKAQALSELGLWTLSAHHLYACLSLVTAWPYVSKSKSKSATLPAVPSMLQEQLTRMSVCVRQCHDAPV